MSVSSVRSAVNSEKVLPRRTQRSPCKSGVGYSAHSAILIDLFIKECNMAAKWVGPSLGCTDLLASKGGCDAFPYIEKGPSRNKLCARCDFGCVAVLGFVVFAGQFRPHSRNGYRPKARN